MFRLNFLPETPNRVLLANSVDPDDQGLHSLLREVDLQKKKCLFWILYPMTH